MTMPTDTTFIQRQVAKLPLMWKLKVIRCGVYATIVAADAFDTGTEGFEALADMTPLQKIKLAIHVFVAMLTVWVAFLDTTTHEKESQLNKP